MMILAHRFVARFLATLCILATSLVADEPATKPNAKPSAPPAGQPDAMPVILLTGFEPFGPGRPPNPSWEAVKPLDGREWHGYRLVAKQLPCVWGEPLDKLQTHIDAHRPVAIFSFGQGAPGAFAIETRASNQRGTFPDNAGKSPARREIVADGPGEVKATIDAEKLRAILVKQGHSVRISTSAGQYLCEETLYTLEHLKTKHADVRHVMFCHVPPLDGKTVTPEFVRTFVLDLLAAWRTTYVAAAATGASRRDEFVLPAAADEPVEKKPAESKPAGAKPAAKEDPRTADVKKFVERYFRTWSNREMDAYGEGFLREAVVQFLDDRGGVNTQGTPEFLADQRRYQAARPAKEYPLAADVRFEGPLARAVVHWKLEDGMNPPRYGYDHFTLVKRDGQWRILNLVFYGTDPPKNGK